MDPLADIRAMLIPMSKTQKIDLLVDEFIRISTAKNAEGGNKKYNGALHGLYTAAQNILDVDVLGSRKNPGIFGGKTTLSEPENVPWNTANSYEAWMLAELNAYATNTPANVTAPLQGNHSDFVGSLQEAKVSVMARLSGAAIKTRGSGPIGLKRSPFTSGPPEETSRNSTYGGPKRSPFTSGPPEETSRNSTYGNKAIHDRILAISPTTPDDTVATEIAELVNVINVLPDNAEKLQLARKLAEKYIARVEPTSTVEDFLKSYGFIKRGGTRRKRKAKRLQSRRK
jgi:hypothetical protein